MYEKDYTTALYEKVQAEFMPGYNAFLMAQW